jgi:hypothetical protein
VQFTAFIGGRARTKSRASINRLATGGAGECVGVWVGGCVGCGVCAKAGSGVSPRRSEWIKALIAIEFCSAPDSSHAHTPLSRILFLFRRGGTPLPAVAHSHLSAVPHPLTHPHTHTLTHPHTHTPTHSHTHTLTHPHTHTPLSLTDYDLTHEPATGSDSETPNVSRYSCGRIPAP